MPTDIRTRANFLLARNFTPLVALVRRMRREYVLKRHPGLYRQRLDEACERFLNRGKSTADGFPRRPQRIHETPVVEINNTCNLDCLMCRTSLATRQKGRMKQDVLRRVLDMVDGHNAIGVELHTIGDPLVNPDLDKVLADLRQKRLTTALTTNGQLLHKQWRVLREYRDVCRGLTFSIDGATPETYERIRVGATWERLLENLELAVRELRGVIPIMIAMVVSKDNSREVGRYITTFRSYVDDPRFDLQFNPLDSLSGEAATDYFDRNNLFPCQTRPNDRCRFVIGESLFFHVDGRVSLCCRDYDGSLVVGDTATQTIDDIWNSDPFVKFQKAHRTGVLDDYRLCKTCSVLAPEARELFSAFMKFMVYSSTQQDAEFYQRHFDRFCVLLEGGAVTRAGLDAMVDDIAGGSDVRTRTVTH